MFSTLVKQINLERVENRAYVTQKIMERIGLRKKSEVHFILRDPESRLQSFFTNKFRQNVKKTDNSNWEHCQKIFFPTLGIVLEDTPKMREEKFQKFTYQNFIDVLEYHYLKDAHLLPQSNMRKLMLKGFNLPIQTNPAHVFIMENKSDLEKMEAIFQLNLSITENKSSIENLDFSLSQSQFETIQTLYKDDYSIYRKWNIHS